MSESPTQDGGYEIRVVSALPGRVRFRVPAQRRTEQSIRQLENAFAQLDGAQVDTNAQTGSVLLHFDTATLDVRAIEEALAGIGVIPVFEVSSAGAEVGAPAGKVRHLADRLNASVAQRTKGVDLKLLVPLGLGALSVRQAVRDSPGLKHAPWYVLAWYAFDSFYKLNVEQRRSVGVGIPEQLGTQSDSPDGSKR